MRVQPEPRLVGFTIKGQVLIKRSELYFVDYEGRAEVEKVSFLANIFMRKNGKLSRHFKQQICETSSAL